jgi:hypothetical protein
MSTASALGSSGVLFCWPFTACSAGGGLYVQFQVLGAARPEDGGPPRAAAGLEVWSVDGRLVRKVEPTRVAAGRRGPSGPATSMSTGLPEAGASLTWSERPRRGERARSRQREPFRLGTDVALGQ